MKNVVLIIGLLYIGYAYGGQMISAGAEIIDGATPVWEQLQEFLNK
jgi:hypothetical protein|tara:strand:- start:2330 stop:2467 length:138 start_codon:yes stop_codon:yes gene_type:complete